MFRVPYWWTACRSLWVWGDHDYVRKDANKKDCNTIDYKLCFAVKTWKPKSFSAGSRPQ